MNIGEMMRSKAARVILGILIVFSVIHIFSSGYEFGQWLHDKLN